MQICFFGGEQRPQDPKDKVRSARAQGFEGGVAVLGGDVETGKGEEQR